MSFELIFLTMLVVGIFLVGIGFLGVGKAGTAFRYIGRGIREAYTETKGAMESYRPVTRAERARLAEDIEYIRYLEMRGDITAEERENMTKELQRPYEVRATRAREFQEPLDIILTGVGRERNLAAAYELPINIFALIGGYSRAPINYAADIMKHPISSTKSAVKTTKGAIASVGEAYSSAKEVVRGWVDRKKRRQQREATEVYLGLRQTPGEEMTLYVPKPGGEIEERKIIVKGKGR